MTKELIRSEKLHIIHKHGTGMDNLLNILLDIQENSRQQYVDEESASLVAEELCISLSQVYEVLTFYSMLHTKPVARYIIEVCGGVPCHFNHAETVTELLENILGIRMGEKTPDGVFALCYTTCVGACDRGPVMKIGETVYDHLDDNKIREILNKLRGAEINNRLGGERNEDI